MDGSKGSGVAKLVARVSKFVGGAAGAGVALLVFGFLSETALYGYAGLPMLSMDYAAMIEAGANGLVGSLSIAVEEQLRIVVVAVLLLVGIASWLWYDRVRMLQVVFRSPAAFFIGQAAVLVVAVTALAGLLNIARLADPSERPALREQLERELAALESSDEWTPVAEAQLIGRASYPATGLFAPVRYLFRERSVTKHDPARERLDSGYALRSSPVDRDNARRLYGWVFLDVAVLLVLLIFIRRWRVHLSVAVSADAMGPSEKSEAIGDRPDEAARPRWPKRIIRAVTAKLCWVSRVLPVRFIDASCYLLEPIAVLATLVCVGLLPIAHGVLSDSSIGKERVVIQLTDECSPRSRW